jgi:FkbM family methyltransferase
VGLARELWRRATWRLPRWRARLTAGAAWAAWQWATRIRRQARVAGVAVPLGPHLTPDVVAALLNGWYERDELAVVRARLAPDDVVLELGTGIGVLATYCARALGSDRVFTFEANPALEPHIRRLFARNRVSPTLRMCALGPAPGVAELSVTANFTSSSLVVRDAERERVRVPIEPFDAALRALRPTFLVVDIEGAEGELFRHAQLDGVRKICMEVHPAAIGAAGVAEVRARLEGAGFALAPTLSNEHVWFLERPGAGAAARAGALDRPGGPD